MKKLPTAHEYHLMRFLAFAGFAAILMLGAAIVIAYAIWRVNVRADAPAGYNGDPQRGRVEIVAYGCPSCHIIAGTSSPAGLVGPPLDAMSRRSYIAGRFPNQEIWMTEWL